VLRLHLCKRRHLRLFLTRLLEEEAHNFIVEEAEFAQALQSLRSWAELAEAGHLRQKETSHDADFLERIFGEALGYRARTQTPNEYHREKSFSVGGGLIADGALGNFSSGKDISPAAVIELKGSDTDLDHDKNHEGLTPVQQCWQYLNHLPDTPWGIVSNYVTIRLYHRSRPPREYEEFSVADFKDDVRLKQFYYVFERHGLVGNRLTEPRAVRLLKQSAKQQRQVSADQASDVASLGAGSNHDSPRHDRSAASC